MSQPNTSAPPQLRAYWHEDMGPQLWWVFPVTEPPYCGSPLYSDWPDYHTHFTPIPIPESPSDQWNAALAAQPSECLSDVISHHNDFVQACTAMRDQAEDEADTSYWQHQIDVLVRMKNQALAASQAETTKFRDIAFSREEMIGQLVSERDASQAEVARLKEQREVEYKQEAIYTAGLRMERDAAIELRDESRARYEQDHRDLCDVMYRERDELRDALATSQAEVARLTSLNGDLAIIAVGEKRQQRDDYSLLQGKIDELEDELARLRSPAAAGEDSETRLVFISDDKLARARPEDEKKAHLLVYGYFSHRDAQKYAIGSAIAAARVRGVQRYQPLVDAARAVIAQYKPHEIVDAEAALRDALRALAAPETQEENRDG